MMCFFQNIEANEDDKIEIAENAVNREFDMAVLEILLSFI